MKKTKKIVSLLLSMVMITSIFVGCGENKGETTTEADNEATKVTNNKIVVASKDYTEAFILGHMFASIIEYNTDLKVDRKINLGGTSIILEAIKSDEIDIYPEYTGTAYGSIMNQSELKDPDAVFQEVKKFYDDEFNITWIEPLGYNNTYALAVRKDTAEKYDLKTCSDLAKVSKELTLGCTFEFADREDGYLGIQKLYDMYFKDAKCVNGVMRYQALANKKSDVVDAFTTEGLLKSYDLVVLEDDKQFFPPYYVAPIVRNQTLEEHPEVKTQLDKLSGLINEETMTALNYKVDSDNEDPKKVADDFLREKGLID